MFSFADIVSFLPTLLAGALVTIEVSLASFAAALVLGLLLGLARISTSPLARWPASAFIQLLRGTPLLTQLFFIYYVLPYGGIVLPPFAAGVIGLACNYAAYMAELFRAGVQAVPRGQWDAGRAIGMRRGLLMRRIILPQAVRVVMPGLGNFFVSIFKDSSLVSVITMKDLTFSGEMLAAATFKHFEIFALVAAIYLTISYPATKLVEWVEARTDPAFAGRRKEAQH